jgi:uncharacterized protein YndB with AHSA1/START domain
MTNGLRAHVVESATVEIDAPPAVVWAVLVDYERYPEWNPYTVRVETTLDVGTPIDLYLPDPHRPGDLFCTREWIAVVEPPRHLQYDTRDELDGIHAVRDQWVQPLGAERCSYRTTDTFTGPYAAVVMELQGQWVSDGFDAVAHALKQRVEQLAGTT